jgi:hypothetical protein
MTENKKSSALDHPRASKKHTTEGGKKSDLERIKMFFPFFPPRRHSWGTLAYTHAFAIFGYKNSMPENFRKNIKFLLLLLDFHVFFHVESNRRILNYLPSSVDSCVWMCGVNFCSGKSFWKIPESGSGKLDDKEVLPASHNGAIFHAIESHRTMWEKHGEKGVVGVVCSFFFLLVSVLVVAMRGPREEKCDGGKIKTKFSPNIHLRLKTRFILSHLARRGRENNLSTLIFSH